MAVLGLLKEKDMHGYELKKRLADIFGVPTAVSFGSLYPALARLEAAGAVSAAGEGPQASSAHVAERRTGRRKKVYSITAPGAKMFVDLLTSSQAGPDDDRSFNVRLAFARYLPPDARLGLLERRRVVLGERLAQVALRARAKRDDHYMRILWDRQQDSLTRDVSWLDQLIREEHSAGTAAQGPTPGSLVVPPGLDASLLPRPLPARERLVPLASASQLQSPGRRPPARDTFRTESSNEKDGI
jgi:DNA-binding PadR family transcriptional regulator